MGQVHVGLCADQVWRIALGLVGGLIALVVILFVLLAFLNRELLEKSLSGGHIIVISATLTIVGLGLASYYTARSAQASCPRPMASDSNKLASLCQGTTIAYQSKMGTDLMSGSLQANGGANIPSSLDGAIHSLGSAASLEELNQGGLLVLGEKGQSIDWTDRSRQDWAPANGQTEVSMLLCTGPKKSELIETCHYGGGININRYRQGIAVRLVEVQTGQTLVSATLNAEPPACQPLGLQDLVHLRAQVQYQDVKDWVQKVLSGQPAPGVSPTPTTVSPTTTPAPTPSRTPEPSPTPQVMGTVKMGSRVRRGPSIDDAVLGGLVKGNQVLVLGASKDRAWLQILTPKGESGWIFAELVTLPVDPADLPLSP
jgi:hypothetical protein